MHVPPEISHFTTIPFAIHKTNGEIVSIDDVPGGLACDCRCPACHADLVGKKGADRVHHFAHYRKSLDLCQFAAETSIRLMLLAELTHDKQPASRSLSGPNLTGEVLVGGSHGFLRETFDLTRPVLDVYIYQQASLYPQIILTPKPSEQPENEAVCLGLYLPAANAQDVDPDWVGAFATAWPKRGLLTVNYSVLYSMLVGRAMGIPVTESLLHFLFTSKQALRWLYHPVMSAKRREITERLAQRLANDNQRRQLLEAETQKRQEEEAISMRRMIAERNARNAQPVPDRPVLIQPSVCQFCGQLLISQSSAEICGMRECVDKWHQLVDGRERAQAMRIITADQLQQLIVSTGKHPEFVPILTALHAFEIPSGWFVQTEQDVWFIFAEIDSGASRNVRYSAAIRTGYCLSRNKALDIAFRTALMRS